MLSEQEDNLVYTYSYLDHVCLSDGVNLLDSGCHRSVAALQRGLGRKKGERVDDFVCG